VVQVGDQGSDRFIACIRRRTGEVFVAVPAHALDVLAQLGQQRCAALLDCGVQVLGLLLRKGHAAHSRKEHA
jgi:hypothetical protein